MGHTVLSAVVSLSLFTGMLLLLVQGHRFGRRRLLANPEGAAEGAGPLDGAVFALLGLLIAFTFSGAASRFDGRRQLIVEEANDIGTAWLRIDLLPDAAQPAMRDLFRRYLDSRLETYRRLPDVAAAEAELARTAALQGEIWSLAVTSCRAKGDTAGSALFLGALNAMFDVVTTRTAASRLHPPTIVFGLLVALALACAFLAGFGMASRVRPDLLRLVAFSGIMALCVYVILDLEYPRAGLIRIDAFDSVLVELRASMRR
jgi:hypothetical protein